MLRFVRYLILLLVGSKGLSLWRGEGGFRNSPCYLEKLPTALMEQKVFVSLRYKPYFEPIKIKIRCMGSRGSEKNSQYDLAGKA